MVSEFREFENQKADKKTLVLMAWKMGYSVARIAREVGVTRDTVYRWVKDSDTKLARNAARNRHLVDTATKFKIIELFVLLKKPSMKKLSEELQKVFAIHLSPSQLRRYLIKWGMQEYRPSAAFDSLLRLQAQSLSAAKPSRDDAGAVESSRKWLEYSEDEELLDLHIESEGLPELRPEP